MPKERVLITVKTYPTLSKTYTELVCTAGFREDGSWIRIYPSPFRFLDDDKKYQKYQWINIDLEKNPKDKRPESHRPINRDSIELGEIISTKNSWKERRDFILGKNKIFTNLQQIIKAAHNNEFSLVIFKPKKILDFTYEATTPNWELNKKEIAEAALKQGSFFDDETKQNFKLMPKLPYKFRYRFVDDADKESMLMIEDWEIGQLYLNCRKKFNADVAAQKVKDKYLNDFAFQKDIYFFLGTSLEWHNKKAPNPYMIIGTFHPPFVDDKQASFL